MKSVLISIQPKWCELIASGKKTIEVRKTRPNIETPFKVYVYMTKRNWIFKLLPFLKNRFAKVIGEFVCDWVTKITPSCDIKDCVNQYIHGYPAILDENDCLSFQEMKAYLGNKNGYDWHISDLKIYDKPKELGEFRKPCVDVYQYCQGCRYGNVIISPDEEEYAMYHGGNYETFDTICCNHITRPPQSWCYVEEINE